MESLIEVKQLPVIEERLRTLKERWEQRALDAEARICTLDTIQAVKAFRADMRKEFDEVEALRKQAKQAIMRPYNQLEAIYKDCITTAYQKADSVLSSKISEVESEIKRQCEDGLRRHFDELCAAHRLDWLTYEQAGIKVDMASAKAKTPKKLREQLAAFVVGVSESVDRINLLDDAEEIMMEFQRSLDAADAICTVQERHRRIEEQKSAREAHRAAQEQEDDRVRRVEALAPPVVTEVAAKEETVKVSFTMHPKISQYEEKIKPIMKELKKICIEEGIQYE